MSKAAELAALIGSQTALSNRNLIINGAMQVAQRGGTTTINNSQSYSAVDRFQGIGSSGGMFDITQSTTTPDGFKNSLKVEVTTADSSIAASEYYVIDQRIEGSNIPQLAWGTSAAKDVTLSFWVRSSVTGTHGGAVSNSATDRSYPYTYTISAADTWEHKSITIDGDTSGTWLTTNGIGIRLYWGLGAGASTSGTADAWGAAEYRTATGAVQLIGTANATWYITGVQLEVGEQATAFEHRSYGDELQKCKRYFQTYNEPPARGVTSGSSTDRMAFMLPVAMRVASSVTMSGTLNWYDGAAVGTITSLSATYTEPHSVEFDASAASGSSSAGRGMVIYNAGANGTLNMDAEL